MQTHTHTQRSIAGKNLITTRGGTENESKREKKGKKLVSDKQIFYYTLCVDDVCACVCVCS